MASVPNPRRVDPRVRILATLGQAAWEYDAEIDEMEIILPGGAGREGLATLVADESYVRVDPDTFEPLSIIVPAYTSWLAQQPAQPATQPTTDPRRWLAIPQQTAQDAIRRLVRTSKELAAAPA